MNQEKGYSNFAPGMRVVIRDAEWVIRKVDTSSDGGQQLTCDGVSELVRDKPAIFLTRLEGDIQILDLPITHKYGYTIPPGSSKENPSHINCRAAYPRHID
ncbi:MAG: hypothetical protein JMN25_15660 [gamma proteobacterium endosymbiont of Lamellibrachia anaximandri]|nr:hypothetical protein [gamma proteobacterium endosymbiont of Lamellibrachia anaximandri]